MLVALLAAAAGCDAQPGMADAPATTPRAATDEPRAPGASQEALQPLAESWQAARAEVVPAQPVGHTA